LLQVLQNRSASTAPAATKKFLQQRGVSGRNRSPARKADTMTRNAFKVLDLTEPDAGSRAADGGSQDTGPVIESTALPGIS